MKNSSFCGDAWSFWVKKGNFLTFFRKCQAQAYEREKRSLRTRLGREAASAKAVYTKTFICESRVGDAGEPKRANCASANSRRKRCVGEAEGQQLVCVQASFTLRSRPPTPLVVKWVSEWVITFWVLYFFGTFICFRVVLNLNCYMVKKVQKNFLMGFKIWWTWGWEKKIKITMSKTIFNF